MLIFRKECNELEKIKLQAFTLILVLHIIEHAKFYNHTLKFTLNIKAESHIYLMYGQKFSMHKYGIYCTLRGKRLELKKWVFSPFWACTCLFLIFHGWLNVVKIYAQKSKLAFCPKLNLITLILEPFFCLNEWVIYSPLLM